MRGTPNFSRCRDHSLTYIERVAHKLSGGAGPSGFTSSQLQDLLLKYGNHSAELREAFSALSRKLANTIV